VIRTHHLDAPVDDRAPTLRLSYVVPAHDEALTLPGTIPALAERLRAHPGSEIIVVENGSADDTQAVARELARDCPVPMRVECSAPGIGAAYRRGIEVATGDVVVCSAADLPFAFTDLDAYLAQPELPAFAIGSKGHDESVARRSLGRRVMSAMFALLRWVLLDMSVRDPQGTMLVERELAQRLAARTAEDGFMFSTELTAAAIDAGVGPVELPIRLEPERRPSSVRPMHDAVSMLAALWRVRRRRAVNGTVDTTVSNPVSSNPGSSNPVPSPGWWDRLDTATGRVSALVMAAVIASAAIHVPRPPRGKDPEVYLEALRQMRAGRGYYPAMDSALRKGGIWPVQSPRGLRSPWLFEFWNVLPGDRGVWIAFLVGVIAAAWASAGLVRHSEAVVPLVVALTGFGVGAAMAVEPWAAPWMLAALALALRGRDGVGASCALVAVLARELALPVVFGGLLWSLARGRRPGPWLLALALSFVSFWLHARWSAPYLRTPGQDAPLWGSASWGSLPRMLGYGLPFGMVTGPVVGILAWVQAVRRRWVVLVGPVLAFGFVGLVVERPYWGAMVVPVSVLLAADLIGDLPVWRRLRSRRPTRTVVF
jgi:hypothetical protein